jgi:hypothetical protein
LTIYRSINALAESFNGLYKWELIHRHAPWQALEDVEFATMTYVEWFNQHRLTAKSPTTPPSPHQPTTKPSTTVKPRQSSRPSPHNATSHATRGGSGRNREGTTPTPVATPTKTSRMRENLTSGTGGRSWNTSYRRPPATRWIWSRANHLASSLPDQPPWTVTAVLASVSTPPP